jgi:hypothetical protein
VSFGDCSNSAPALRPVGFCQSAQIRTAVLFLCPVCGHSLFEIDIGKQITLSVYPNRAWIPPAALSTAQESDSCSSVSLAAQFFSSLLDTF